jgi:hypothetical protein
MCPYIPILVKIRQKIRYKKNDIYLTHLKRKLYVTRQILNGTKIVLNKSYKEKWSIRLIVNTVLIKSYFISK